MGGCLIMARLGVVDFTVIEETPSFSNSVTEKAVEGSVIVDNVKQNSTTLNIIGVVTGDDAFIKLQQLRRYSRSGELLKYTGRNAFVNVVIEALTTTHNVRVRNGFEFGITLKEVRIAKAKIVELNSNEPVSNTPPAIVATQTKPVTNKGRQVPKPKNADETRVAQSIIKYVGVIA